MENRAARAGSSQKAPGARARAATTDALRAHDTGSRALGRPLLGRWQNLQLHRQREDVVFQIVVDVHRLGVDLVYLLSVAQPPDVLRPLHAAADIAVPRE